MLLSPFLHFFVFNPQQIWLLCRAGRREAGGRSVGHYWFCWSDSTRSKSCGTHLSEKVLVELCTKGFRSGILIGWCLQVTWALCQDRFYQIDYTRSNWNNNNFMVVLYVSQPNRNDEMLCPFLPWFWVIIFLTLVQILWKFHMTSSNLKLSDLVGAAQIPSVPNFFYTVSEDHNSKNTQRY